jgi:hypothetical protein
MFAKTEKIQKIEPESRWYSYGSYADDSHVARHPRASTRGSGLADSAQPASAINRLTATLHLSEIMTQAGSIYASEHGFIVALCRFSREIQKALINANDTATLMRTEDD